MKTKRTKKRKLTYTREEYLRKFQPSKVENRRFFQQSPQEIGIKLADEAIVQLRETLVSLHKAKL